MAPRLLSIAIVGGSGFIGSALAENLRDQFRVTIVDVKPSMISDVRFTRCDIRDKEAVDRQLREFDLIINTAVVQVPEVNERKRFGYEVNVLGVQNLCELTESSDSIRGLIHASSWHVFGERDFRGNLDEMYGFRPDKVDERARFYALCKIAQEVVIRLTSEMSSKDCSILRLGTVLGTGMPRQTAANIFIESALRNEPIRPFKHSMHRPMLYVDLRDVCVGFRSLVTRIADRQATKEETAPRTVNVIFPHAITVIELAQLVQRKVTKLTCGRIKPKIEIVDTGEKVTYSPKDKKTLRVSAFRARRFLGIDRFTPPEESVEQIIAARLQRAV